MEGLNYFLKQINLPPQTSGKVEFSILNNDPFVIVERMSWDNETGERKSAIVKHLPWDQIPLKNENEVDPAIQYETAAYQFLCNPQNNFTYFPKVIGIFPGIILMEDFGSEEFNFPDELSAQRSILDTLARLHSASLGKQELYESILRKNGIPEIDERIVSHSKWDFKILNGRKSLQDLADMLGIHDRNWIKELEKAETLMYHPDPFHGFLHNDLTSFKQSTLLNGQLYLLDFETARFGHVLVDVFNLFLGKLESNSRKGIWFRKYYLPGTEVIEFYIKQFEKYSSRKFGDDLWHFHTAGIVIAMTVAMIGKLKLAPTIYEEMGYDYTPGRPIAEDLQQLLRTCIKCAGNHHAYKSSLNFFNELAEKIPLIPELNVAFFKQ